MSFHEPRHHAATTAPQTTDCPTKREATCATPRTATPVDFEVPHRLRCRRPIRRLGRARMPATVHTVPRNLRGDFWHALLHRWGKLLDRYQRMCNRYGDDDVAYWYGERALTGFLTAAALQLKGGIGLEEFLGYRGTGKKRRAGRGDAWLSMGNHWFCLEAKQYFVSGGSKTAISAVDSRLRAARKQLNNLGSSWK